MTAKRQLQDIARRAMRDRGFDPTYSPSVLDELQALPNVARPASGHRDLRDLPWSSIDNDDSRDLDQLTVATSADDGSIRLLIAIADVESFVRRAAPIDQRAALNTTSVYTAAEVFPMLPEALSTDRTSLVANADRLAMVVQVDVGSGGIAPTSDVYAALVRSRAKLAYGSVGEWLDGHGTAPPGVAAVAGLDGNLRQQDAAAQLLRRLRREQGALTFRERDVRPVFIGDKLENLTEDHPNRAKELIEELMIAANTVTARVLSAARVPSLRRIVRVPKRWDRIVALAAATGARLPEAPDSRALAQWLAARELADPDGFRDLSTSVIKLIGRGEYVAVRPDAPPIGHFGLGLQDYTHATAPNRRFIDLVTQRLLKATLGAEATPYQAEELDAIAERCTEREGAANAVERQVRKSAAALLLAERIGETFDAIVTGVTAKGTWVQLKQPAAEGRLEGKLEGIDVGDRMRVRLLRTDVPRGFVDFARVS